MCLLFLCHQKQRHGLIKRMWRRRNFLFFLSHSYGKDKNKLQIFNPLIQYGKKGWPGPNIFMLKQESWFWHEYIRVKISMFLCNFDWLDIFPFPNIWKSNLIYASFYVFHCIIIHWREKLVDSLDNDIKLHYTSR
jgi:hypothetical protein